MPNLHNRHEYASRLVWDDPHGDGTTDYASYSRRYRVQVAGKPELAGSADPMFRGEATRHNPEDLFLAALSSCHMLSYLALCARRGVRVLAYQDDAVGTMVLTADGGGHFETVTLRPRVTIEGTADTALALQLHHNAHALCFIANSCRVPIRHEAIIVTADPTPRQTSPRSSQENQP